MKNILILNGSPRRNGKTASLVTAFAVCKALSLALRAVLGNRPAFFLREAAHDGQQDLTLGM